MSTETSPLRLRAPAKLNLRLEVGPPGADGYHPLRTLLVALEGLHDTVRVTRAPTRSIVCPGIAERDNLAWRALDVLERATERSLPVAVEIDKRIPPMAGLGGGSSDAAAVMRAVDELHGLSLGAARLQELAGEVGADVPFFVRGGVQWATGRGDRLSPGRAEPFWAVLAMASRSALSTAAVYRRFDAIGSWSTPAPVPPSGAPAFPALGRWVRNDLWSAALALEPRLGSVARELRAAGARAVLMCGSGACVAGLAADRMDAERVASRLTRARVVAVVSGPARPDRSALTH